MKRALDVLLLLVATAGMIMAWRTGRERRELRAAYDRLARSVGDFAVVDPTRVNIMALETGEPLQFAWRVHVPANLPVGLVSAIGGSSSSCASDPRDLVVRVRVRERGRGVLEVYTLFAGGGSLTQVGGPDVADLLRGRWGDLIVERAGVGGVSALDPRKPHVLLRLKLPDDLAARAQSTLPPDEAKRLVPVFVELTLPASSMMKP